MPPSPPAIGQAVLWCYIRLSDMDAMDLYTGLRVGRLVAIFA
jgi:hypothetical protein